MNSGIHSPLGKDRKTPAKRPSPFSAGRIIAFVVLVGLAGISTYAYLRPDPLVRTAPVEVAGNIEPADADKTDTTPPEETAADKLTRSRPGDGANVVRQMLEDGSIVTKITPRSRDDKGPVIIDANANGAQDPRSASFPDSALIEDSDYGPLPIVSVDGVKPVDRYARPWSGARGTRIVIVIGGLGLSQTGTQRALKVLPEEITLAFAANGNSLGRWMPEARRLGHELLLQVPMEPFDYPDNDPGPLTLTHENPEPRNLDLLHKSMAKMTNYTGVMNYLGGRMLSDAPALEPVMRDIGNRGLLFLDDGTAAQSLSGTFAKTFSAPHAFADMVLDQEVNRTAILARLDDLERVARRKGAAIGVASAFDESVDAVAEWAKEAGARGIEIVGISAVAEVPN